jgi:hypothetical protein
MAQKIIEEGLLPVEEYYGSEVTLYYPGLYAGSTDLVCNHNGLDTIIDFKQANRPKKLSGLRIIFYKLPRIVWHMTTFINQKLNKVLLWSVHLTCIIKSLSFKTLI